MQEYKGRASVNVGFFRAESSFTEDQTDDAIAETQLIVIDYDWSDEEQVCGVLTADFTAKPNQKCSF